MEGLSEAPPHSPHPNSAADIHLAESVRVWVVQGAGTCNSTDHTTESISPLSAVQVAESISPLPTIHTVESISPLPAVHTTENISPLPSVHTAESIFPLPRSTCRCVGS